MPRILRILVLVMALLPVALGPAYASGMADVDESGIYREYRLKAAFVQRLLNVVTWPAAKDDTAADDGIFILGVVGEGPMFEALQKLSSTRIGDLELVVVKADEHQGLPSDCRAIFVSAIIDGQPRSAHPVWGDPGFTAVDHVLTIGEDPYFTADGGVIRFYNHEDKLRFAVSTGAAARAGLTVGSKLMRLATVED